MSGLLRIFLWFRKESKVIKPTVGRVMWYYPAENDPIHHIPGQPLAALVAMVHSDEMVNLTVSDSDGNPHGVRGIQVVQEGQELPATRYCTWMPYQIGQAKKTEELQEQLAAK